MTITFVLVALAGWLLLDIALVAIGWAWGRKTARRRANCVHRTLVAGSTVRLTSTPHRQVNR